MMYELLPPFKKGQKKMKDKRLRTKLNEAIAQALADYTVGDRKTGKLKKKRFYTISISYNKTDYRMAYCVKQQTIYFVLFGPHEGFYNELLRYEEYL